MATERQITFARAVARGLEPIQALAEAGYSESANYAWKLIRSPAVVEIIRQELEAQRVDAGAIGFRVMREIAEKGKNEGARVTAARTLLEYAGLIGRQAGDAVKDPAEMSTAELRQLLAKVDSEIASRAKPVNGPEASTIPQQVLDLLAD
jgi:hypothetical protein